MGQGFRQMRLKSCVEAILKVRASLDDQILDPELNDRLNQLESSLKSIEFGLISEKDVQRVEEATNRLLEELKIFFPESDGRKPSFDKRH